MSAPVREFVAASSRSWLFWRGRWKFSSLDFEQHSQTHSYPTVSSFLPQDTILIIHTTCTTTTTTTHTPPPPAPIIIPPTTRPPQPRDNTTTPTIPTQRPQQPPTTTQQPPAPPIGTTPIHTPLQQPPQPDTPPLQRRRRRTITIITRRRRSSSMRDTTMVIRWAGPLLLLRGMDRIMGLPLRMGGIRRSSSILFLRLWRVVVVLPLYRLVSRRISSMEVRRWSSRLWRLSRRRCLPTLKLGWQQQQQSRRTRVRARRRAPTTTTSRTIT